MAESGKGTSEPSESRVLVSALLVSSCCRLLLGRMLGHRTARHVVSHQAKEEDTAL